jgi:hypothetical protein
MYFVFLCKFRRGHPLAQGFKYYFGLEFRTEFSSAFFHSDSNLLVFLQRNLLSYFWGLFHQNIFACCEIMACHVILLPMSSSS